MKCNNCGTEWSGPANVTGKINTCPFCGKSLKPESTEFSSMDEVLAYIVRTFGMESLEKGQKLQSYFADFAPQLKKERVMLRYFIECNGHNVLMKALHEKPQEAKIRINSVILRMEEELMIMPEAAKSVCRSFWTAIGGNKEAMEIQARAVSFTTAAPTPAKAAPAAPVQPQAKSTSQTSQASTGMSSLVDVLEQRRMQMVQVQEPKNQNPSPKKPAAPSPVTYNNWARTATQLLVNYRKDKKIAEQTSGYDGADRKKR